MVQEKIRVLIVDQLLVVQKEDHLEQGVPQEEHLNLNQPTEEEALEAHLQVDQLNQPTGVLLLEALDLHLLHREDLQD